MRIINQRRNRSVNFDNVEIHIEDTRILAFVNVNFTIVLGEYETEERTNEIFREIHGVYSGNVKLDTDFEFSNTEITVYEMPIS